MEEQTQKRLDSVLEDELRRGYRVKELPADLQEQVTADGGAAIQLVRFTRLNPSRRRKIAEVVQRQYQKDIRNPDILSHEQIMKLVRERGEWTDELAKEMSDLQQSTNKAMGEMFMDGAAQTQWTMELLTAAGTFRAKVDELLEDTDTRTAVLARFDRWMEFTPDERERYNRAYASEQGRDQYSVDFDLQRLMEAMPNIEAVDSLNTIDELRDKLHRYLKLQRERLRLAELTLRHSRIFAESAEQRRDNAEEMARLYFTTERVSEDKKPTGPLTPTFEQLYDLPETVIQWLLVEAYFFQNGIPDEAREYLETFGFLSADGKKAEDPSETGESGPSDESPVPRTSRPDSSPPEVTEADSSELRAPMISMTGS